MKKQKIVITVLLMISLFFMFKLIDYKIYRRYQKTEQAQKHIDNYLNKSESNIINGNLQEAIKYLDIVLDIDSDNAKAYQYRAAVNYYREDYQKSLQDYQQLLRLDALSIKLYRNMGAAHLGLKQYKKAIEKFNQAVVYNKRTEKDKEELAKAYSNKGIAEKNLGDYKAAIESFKKALEANETDIFARNNKALIYTEQNEFDKAEKQFEKVLELDSNYAMAYGGLGRLYYNHGLTERAINNFEACKELRPGYPDVYYYLGELYQKLDRLNLAAKNYRRGKVLGNARAEKRLETLENDLIMLEAKAIEEGRSNFITETGDIIIGSWKYKDGLLYYRNVDEYMPMFFYEKPELEKDETEYEYKARLIFELKTEIEGYGV